MFGVRTASASQQDLEEELHIDSELTAALTQPHLPQTKILFVSSLSINSGTIAKYSLRSQIESVLNCRTIGKKDMKFNDTMPKMHVDAESYVSRPFTCRRLRRGEYWLT